MPTFLSTLARAMGVPEPFGIPKPVFRVLAGPVFFEPMVSSFSASNDKIRDRLGFEPGHPTYREGVTAVTSAYAGDLPLVPSEREQSSLAPPHTQRERRSVDRRSDE